MTTADLTTLVELIAMLIFVAGASVHVLACDDDYHDQLEAEQWIHKLHAEGPCEFDGRTVAAPLPRIGDLIEARHRRTATHAGWLCSCGEWFDLNRLAGDGDRLRELLDSTFRAHVALDDTPAQVTQ